MTLKIYPAATVQGVLRPPSDKSLTHRAYMLAAIAKGESVVRQPLRGEDCECTLSALTQMGLTATWVNPREVRLMPAPTWIQPKGDLNCGNSGTTMRLLSGLIGSRVLDVTLIGDASLSRRPMKRIAEPLRLMGATVDGDNPPLHIVGGNLRGIQYRSPVASAQVKSCILLAGLRANGPSHVIEPSLSRDHTERMLRAMGAKVDSSDGVRIQPTTDLHHFTMNIPADVSSAAFFMVAAAIMPEGQLALEDLSVNPTRTGILEVFEKAGVDIVIGHAREELGEPVAEVEIRATQGLRPFTISGALVPRLIDEIPILAIMATQCHGESIIKDARELRVKESDRIEQVVNGLRLMGADVESREDGMVKRWPRKLKGATNDAHGDHRIAMAFAIAGLIAEGETTITGADAIRTSYPNFESDLQRLCVY